MAYGSIKVDNVIYTKGGVDTTITVSGIVDSLSGAISVTGAISGASVSAATGTFTTLSGNTTAGTTATFTSGVFTTFSGTTVNVVSGVFASGTVALPSVSVGTSGNGLYSPGANQLAISTSGTGRLTVDNSGNVNIDSGTFYVDAVNNRVGVGTTGPTCALDIAGSIQLPANNALYINGASNYLYADATATELTSATQIKFVTNGALRATLDASGNLGLGVVPSAWSGYGLPVMELPSGGTIVAAGSSQNLGANWYYSGGNFLYKTAAAATYLQQASGAFRWYTSTNTPSVGAAITFTQAMTLNASGNLLLGTTTDGPFSRNLLLNGSSSAGILFRVGDVSKGFVYADSTDTYLGANTGAVVFKPADTERARIDSSGNLGLGVVPKAWGASFNVLDFAGASFASNTAGTATFIAQNAYYDSAWKYKSSTNATLFQTDSGSFQWYTSTNTPSTNGAITFTQAMTLDASGNLGIGATSSLSPITVERSGATSAEIKLNQTGASGRDYRIASTGSGYGSAGNLIFYDATAGAERMKINNTGTVTINGATSVATGTHTIQDSGSSPNTLRLYNNTDSNNTGNRFLICDAAASVLRAEIRSNGGLANFQANNVNLSDRNVKKDISPAAGTWDCIKEWEIVNYRYKDQPDDAALNLGVIAQQVAESCSEVITVFQEAKEATEDQPAQEERLGVKEQQMYWMAIKALQEAQARIETLEAKVAALESR